MPWAGERVPTQCPLNQLPTPTLHYVTPAQAPDPSPMLRDPWTSS